MATKKAKGMKKCAAKKTVAAMGTKVKAGQPKKLKIAEVDLDALRKPVEAAKVALVKVRAEAKEVTEKAESAVAQAKDAYMKVFAPYREACRKAGTKCEFDGGRSASVTEQVRFELERTERGIRVAIRGVPKSEETIPFGAFKQASVSKVAYAYTDKHIGPKERVGNKGGGLSNRLRALLSGSKA